MGVGIVSVIIRVIEINFGIHYHITSRVIKGHNSNYEMMGINLNISNTKYVVEECILVIKYFFFFLNLSIVPFYQLYNKFQQ